MFVYSLSHLDHNTYKFNLLYVPNMVQTFAKIPALFFCTTRKTFSNISCHELGCQY